MTKDLIYDIEVYPNIFCLTFMDARTEDIVTYEMSDRKDEWDKFLKLIDNCKDRFVRWVGFNNYYYDYQVIHKLLNHEPFKTMSGSQKAELAFKVSDKIIKMSKDEKFQHVVWDNDHVIPQIDL